MAFSFMATFGGDASPLRKELSTLEKRAQMTGRTVTSSIGGSIASAIAMRFGGFMAVYKAFQFIGESVKADISMQRIKNTLEAASRSAEQAASDFKFLWSESNRVGFSFLESANAFARFEVAAKSANLTAAQTRDIFTSVQESAMVMGLTTEQSGAVMLALEQMMSKGTVMSQELRLQLGNAMPGAMDTFARALGVTQAEMYKMVEAGTVLSKDAVPKFAAELKKSFNLTDDANKTIRDINRMKNAFLELKADVGELSRPITSGVVQWLGGLAKVLDGEPFRIFMDIVGGYKQRGTEADAKARLQAMEKTLANAKELKALLEPGKMKPWIQGIIDPKEAEKEAEKMMDRVVELTRQTAEIRQRMETSGLSNAEKVVALSKERAENEAKIAGLTKEIAEHPGAPGTASAALSIAELKKRNAEIDQISTQIGNDFKDTVEQSASSGGHGIAITDWERAGGFMAGPQVALLEVNQQQLAALNRIDAKLGNPGAYGVKHARGVNFGGGTR